MKNIRYLIPTLFIFCAFFLPLSTFAQIVPKGYEIRFKPQNVNDKYLFLVGIYGNKTYVVDSAKFKNKQYVFKNSKQILPSGFYTIQSRNGDIFADFLVDQTRKFTIEESGPTLAFINSDENIAFQNFKNDLAMGNEIWHYPYTAPESLLGKFVLAQYIPVQIPEFFWGSEEGRDAAAQKYYQYLIDHYFDNIDFKDIRLMYTTLDVDLKAFFMKSLFPQTAENVINSIENLFHRILDENPTDAQLDVRDFYLKKLIHLYMSADPKLDTVFVYLVDNYVSKLTESTFISDSEVGVFKRIADRKRRTLVGQAVPVFESFTSDNHKISTADMPSKYTLLWFWDPDCDHCLEYTPELYDFYCKYHTLYDFDVIACSVTEDYDRWIAFIAEHHLEWFNTSYAVAEPNYDAVDYFNLDDTPAIFVIDRQHKIVARQFPLNELIEVFESLEY
jgi:thiol-disulfide isomerase/thioredoxin